MSLRVVRYHVHTASQDCIRHAIVEPANGRKLRVCLISDTGVSVKLVSKREERYMTDLDCPLTRAKRHFRHAGKTLGISKNARRFLRDTRS